MKIDRVGSSHGAAIGHPALVTMREGSAFRSGRLMLSAAIAALLTVISAPSAHAQSYTVGTASDLTGALADANSNNFDNVTVNLSGNVVIPSGTVVPPGTVVSSDPVGNPPPLDLVTGASTLTLDGAGTVWNAGTFSGAFNVDGTAAGGLTVSNGAQLQLPHTAAVGFLSFNSGTLTITGSGSAVTTNYLAMGRGGDAAIVLTNGAHLTADTTAIGECCGSTTASNITVLVDGAGTVWNAGYFSAGGATDLVNVTVSKGATIQATSGSGIGLNGNGSMLVTGAGSSFVVGNSGALYLGGYTYGGVGHGTLAISDGGLVSAGSVLLGVNDPGTSGTLLVNTGGVLETGSLAPQQGGATATFDDGTLRATADSTSGAALVSGFAAGGFSLGAGGLFLDSQGFNVAATSVISGVGGLTKQGTGTLTLTADNTYTGGTTISSGTLQLGNGGASGSIAGDVTDNGMLAFDRSDAVTYSGVVSGPGALSQIGAGTTILTGANSYTGGTMIAAGTLQLGAGGTTGSILGDVVNDGTLAFNRSDTVTFAGDISGSGAVSQMGAGTTVLTGTGTYSGGTTISGGTLQLGNGGTAGSIVGNVNDNGTLVFDRSDEVDFAGTISGNGGVVQAGTGNTVFNTAQAYTGNTSIVAGTLTVNGSVASAVTVNAAGTLAGTGTVFGSVTNAGTVSPGNGSTIGTLTVGSYLGQSGTLAIKAVLGDDLSPTDRLVVTGDTSGSTNVRVTNVGGPGAQTAEGIRIIDVKGASNGSFSLVGDYLYQGQQAVVAGAYAYRLYQGGTSTPNDGDWYLRSVSTATTTPPDTTPPPTTNNPAPLYAPGVPLYEAYAGVLQRLNQIGTLKQREGDPDFNGASTDQSHSGAAWVRVYTDHADLSPETSTTGTGYDATTQKAQVGVDGMLHEGSNGVLVAGLTAQFGKVTSDVSSSFGEGRIKTTGNGMGATLTWYGANGFYVDGVAQWNRYRSDLNSYTLARQLADHNHATGYVLSVEAGQKLALDDEWSLIPQGQLMYSSVRFNGFTDPYGAAVSRRDGDSLAARAGLAMDHESNWRGDAGMNRVHIYGIANLYYDFMDGTKTDVSGLTLNSRNAPLWGGLGLGGSLSWKDGRYRLFGEALAQTSMQHFGDSSSYSLRVGFNMRW